MDRLDGKSNYFIGADPARWLKNVPTFGAVRCKDVYAGVDAIFYGSGSQLEYDLVISPGADPGRISFQVEGGSAPSIDALGDLVIGASFGTIRQHAPCVYEETHSGRVPVSARYVLDRRSLVRLKVGPYDRRAALVVDPVLSYSTYLGGAGFDAGYGIAVDAGGSTYITGGNNYEVFVTKLDASGTEAIYSTHLGGSGYEEGLGIAVDSRGNAYVTGYTNSGDFPTTKGAFQQKNGGGYDAFVAKLNSSGSSLVYSTYLGGSGDEDIAGALRGSRPIGAIAVGVAGNAYVTGYTPSSDFPVSPGVLQNSLAGVSDVFVTELNTSGSGLVFSTHLGGS